jgi:hypothetical protein
MAGYDFLDLPDCDNPALSCTDTWLTDSSYITTPISSGSRSGECDDYKIAENCIGPDQDCSAEFVKKTRVKWSGAEDAKLRRLFSKFPEQWDVIE